MKTYNNVFKTVDLEQGSPEWINWRKLKVSASMAPTLMGENQYETPLMLYEQLIDDVEETDNQFMAEGRRREPEARKWANSRLGTNCQPVCVESMAYPWLAASLDGFQETENGLILHEYKCPTSRNFNHLAYMAQAQCQMFITQAEVCYLIVFYGMNDPDNRIHKIERDNIYCKTLLHRAVDFHERLHAFKPPEPIDMDFIEIGDVDMFINARNYEDACLMEKKALELKTKYRPLLISGCTHPRCKIGNLKITKTNREGRIDYDAIEVLKTIDLEQYRKPSTEVWTIREGQNGKI